MVCFLSRKAGHDHREKQKQPYLQNKALLAKSVLLNQRKHHKEAYDSLFCAGNE
jgi:hypothetical protein